MLESLARRRLLIAALAITTVTLAGCASPNTGDRPSDEPPSTCEEFLAMSDDEIERFLEGGGEMVTLYTSEGATTESELDIYQRECADADPETSLNDFIYFDDSTPDCAVFASLSPEVQDEWREAAYTDIYYEIGRELTTQEFLDACNAFQAGNLIAASNYVKSYGRYTSWQSETRLGYRAQLVLGVQSVLTATDGTEIVHPASSSEQQFVAGAGCGFDPATDAAIPLRMLIVNTTVGQPTTLRGAFSLVSSGSNLTTTAYLEANYTSGAHCSGVATRFAGDAEISVVFQEQTDAGGSVGSNYFVILKNWFSPRNPSGATGELSAYTLVSTSTSDEADPTISTTQASLPLG